MIVTKEIAPSPYYVAQQGHISAIGYSHYEAIERCLAQITAHA